MQPLLPKPSKKLLLPKPRKFLSFKYAKTIFLLSLFSAWLVMPELLLHKLGFVFHHLAVVLHLFYEMLSFFLEESLIHTFGMEKYYAQMLVFYCFLTFGFWCCYRFWRYLPKLIASWRSKLFSWGVEIKYQAIEAWLALTLWQKTKFVVFNLLGLTGGIMILMT